MLFDLANDQGEVKNIAEEYPEEHKKLHSEMMRYFKEVGARLPISNPNFNSESYKKTKGYEKRVIWGPFKGDRALEDDEK